MILSLTCAVQNVIQIGFDDIYYTSLKVGKVRTLLSLNLQLSPCGPILDSDTPKLFAAFYPDLSQLALQYAYYQYEKQQQKRIFTGGFLQLGTLALSSVSGDDDFTTERYKLFVQQSVTGWCMSWEDGLTEK